MTYATYSPEDNKIRIYPDSRLDDETFQRVRAAGFRWAPKQELFVAPAWSPRREDLAIELAGELEPEEMTMAERAQMKADRLEGYAAKRAAESVAFSNAARAISERFAGGQPILKGHHSERKARKDKERMTAAQDKAVKAADAVGYWNYRAQSVEAHANRKNDPRVRARRIKTLLAELRDFQRQLNESYRIVSLWTECDSRARALHLANHYVGTSFGAWSKLDRGEIDWKELKESVIAGAEKTLNSGYYARWIAHILNRLAYESEFLGPIERYTGELSPAIIKTFLRTHGAEQPKAAKTVSGGYKVASPVPFPAHIGNGCELELSADEWRALMHSCGYAVPAKKASLPPILNFKAPTGFVAVKRSFGSVESFLQIELTKAEYSAIRSEIRGVLPSACGQFRVKYCLDPNYKGPRYQAPWVAVYITDQKAHDVPATIAQEVA